MSKSKLSDKPMVSDSYKARTKWICLIFLSISVWFLYSHFYNSRLTTLRFKDQYGTQHTLILPMNDKEKLFGLMEQLFAKDNFAYTILSSKPLSWATFREISFDSWEGFFDSFSQENLTLRLGWETWKKYQHLFPSAHLWTEKPKIYLEYVSILIVNPYHFNAVVIDNKKDFEDVLHREILDGYQLLTEAKDSSLMNEVLGGHQALLGIVLGYGRNNSWDFYEGCEKHIPIGCVWNEESNVFLSEEHMTKDLTLTEIYLSHISRPSFAGDPNSQESIALRREYLSAEEKIIKYYKNKDFLEETLSLLAGYRPEND